MAATDSISPHISLKAFMRLLLLFSSVEERRKTQRINEVQKKVQVEKSGDAGSEHKKGTESPSWGEVSPHRGHLSVREQRHQSQSITAVDLNFNNFVTCPL